MTQMTNMSFEAGLWFKVRVKPSKDSVRFSINIGRGPEDIALHVNPRFNYGADVKALVMNSCTGGSWGQEERGSTFPFIRGTESKFYISFTKEMFTIRFRDGHIMTFPNRFGDDKYDHFFIDGDAKLIGIKFTPIE